MEGQTRVKTLPSRRTTYAGGKNCLSKIKEPEIQRKAAGVFLFTSNTGKKILRQENSDFSFLHRLGVIMCT